MKTISYLVAKILKKARGSSVFASNIHPTSKIESGCQVINTHFAKHTFCGYDCEIINCDVGSFCSIANRVSIGGVRHPIEFVSTSPVFLSHKDSVKAKFALLDYLPQVKTKIGHDVWLGEGVFIKAGVAVGDGAVIGMGSVVTKDVPAYAIVAGNPAQLIRMRFDEDIVRALQKLQWWDLPDDHLSRIGKQFHDPRRLLENEGLL